MSKRSMGFGLLIFFAAAAIAGAQDASTPVGDLEKQVEALQLKNELLSQQVQNLEELVQQSLAGNPDAGEQGILERFGNPDEHYSFSYDEAEEPIRSGFIRKGTFTGTTDKLLNINLFLGARYSAINNDSGQMNDVDGFGIPFARLHLTGQAFTDFSYAASFEFADFNEVWLNPYMDPGMMGADDTIADSERLYEALISWTPSVVGSNIFDDFDVNAGLTRIFLSPAGMAEPWMLDFIEYPQIVYRFLPPNLARDVGVFTSMGFLDQSRLRVWLGLWNGAHRVIRMGTPFDDIPAFDAWGNGLDNDTLALMGRLQVNVLDEEEYFLMFSAGLERNRISYQEVNSTTGALVSHDNKDDRIWDLASEFRMNERKTWIRGEFMHSYLADTQADTQRGYYIAAGTRLDFLHPSLDHLEVLARYDRVKLVDSLHSGDDILDKTLGLNYYFDPEHQNDAKLQLNYVIREDSGLDPANNALLVQFVLGF